MRWAAVAVLSTVLWYSAFVSFTDRVVILRTERSGQGGPRDLTAECAPVFHGGRTTSGYIDVIAFDRYPCERPAMMRRIVLIVSGSVAAALVILPWLRRRRPS